MSLSINELSVFDDILLNINERMYLYVVDKDCKIVYSNPLMKQDIFFGIDPVGKSIFTVFTYLKPEDSTLVQAIQTKKSIKSRTYIYFDKDNHYRQYVFSTYPILKNGKAIGAYEIGEDITGLRLAPKKNADPKVMRIGLTNKHSGEGSQIDSYYTLNDIIGVSPAVVRMKQQIKQMAERSSNIFIYGETGTGKELVAQSLYTQANIKGPFVAYNCSAIPESLMESILFGTVKGSFTGAENRKGLFEYANNGMVFLDEINSMPLSLQAKVLRVLQENTVRRVGGHDEIVVKFRLISATNMSPKELLSKNIIREDLFYRLNVLYIEVPPLRDRMEDIPTLANAFLEELNKQSQNKILGFHENALLKLKEYNWPGNIRELKNSVERAICMCNSQMITEDNIQFFNYQSTNNEIHRPGELPPDLTLNQYLANVESSIIEQALKQCKGNRAAAARRLGLSPQTFHNKALKYRK